jgi:hypothetical protein
MTPHTTETARRDQDDFDARYRRISDGILDGIEQTLDELAQPDGLRAAIQRAAAHALDAQACALRCRHALCRRAKRCRRRPCAVPAPGVGGE